MISVIIPVYHNEETLLENVKRLSMAFMIEEIICVFDGYECEKNTRRYLERYGKVINIYPDIRWGNARARNIGAANARFNYLLFIDVDHTLKLPFVINPKDDCAYKFKRVLHKTEWHPNCMMMHKDIFYEVGGYDERFCGNYGYEDRYFDWKIRRKYPIVHSENELEVLNGGGVELGRDKTINKRLFEKLTHESFLS